MSQMRLVTAPAEPLMAPVDDSTYIGWLRMIAAAGTEGEVARMERVIGALPGSGERERLLALCSTIRMRLGIAPSNQNE
jgi:hypothetical protein